MRAILTDKHPDTILEIGPGWGNYTFMLAELCRELTCVDISPDVLRFLQAVAARQQVYNLGTVCANGRMLYCRRNIRRCLHTIVFTACWI